MSVIVCGDAVLDNHSITITVLIIVVYEVVLVFFVFLRLEFLGAKESAKGVHLVQFLQSTTAKHTAFNLLGLDILITIYIYMRCIFVLSFLSMSTSRIMWFFSVASSR